MVQKFQKNKEQENDYREYIKSVLCCENEDEKICREILSHKKFMDSQMHRDVDIDVAILDYITSINKDIQIPSVFDSLNIRKLYHPSRNHYKKLKPFDTSDLSRDLNTEIERAHRYGSQLSVLMFDLDESIDPDPDSDDISEFFFSNISRHVRRTDTVYSYEKNHYVLILSETNINDAVNTAFNLQNWFQNEKFKKSSPKMINIGIAAYGMHGIDSDHKLISAADKSLCKAKESGGGRICLYQDRKIFDIEKPKNSCINIQKTSERLSFKGLPIHKGMAAGKIFIYNDLLSHEHESYDISEENLEKELSRIITAIENVEKDLSDVEHLVNRDLSEEYAAIFQAHRLILKDSQLFNEIKKDLYEKKINGEKIVRDVFKRWEKRFLAFDDEIFRNKSQDIADISSRRIKELTGIDSHILEEAPEDSIIFANRLLPSDTVNINKNNVKAIVTKEGGKFSHTAILSKAMNIPLVIIENLDLSSLHREETVIVNGETGDVVINPDQEEMESAEKQLEETTGRESLSGIMQKSEKIYYRGEEVFISAAASSPDETEEALLYDAYGIGLFRMEVLYLSQYTLPEEKLLVSEIEKTIKKFKRRESVIRLTDIGGDKTLPYINITERYNSNLGVRGVRLLRSYPAILETQLRSLIKIGQKYDIKIMVPMVTLPEDMVFIKEMILKLKKAMKKEKDIPIGAMIETPSSVITIDEILELSDFVSIGSNDLIQYTMAADREKLSVSKYYEKGNVVVQEFIRKVIEKAASKNIPAYLCGELAQNTDFTKSLLDLGCRIFTVAPVMIPAVRNAVIKASEQEEA